MPLIEARSITVHLGGREILHGVDFAVREGEWVGIVGPNGSGKTTLLRAVAGLLPHGGQLLLDDQPVRRRSPREVARRLAFVCQAQPLAFEFPVIDFVLLGRSPHRGWLEPLTSADRARALEALEEVDLADLGARSVTTLSGGELQRARLAQALAQETPLLLLDEPTAHLDIHHRLDLMQRVTSLVRDGRTVVSALHDLALAARFVDRLLVLDRGRIAADGPPSEVLHPELLREVFRVEADVPAGDPTALRFLAPI